LTALYERSAASTRNHFLDPEYDGWFTTPGSEDTRKGFNWKAGYHVTMMQTELLRLEGFQFRSGSEVLL
jgi:hypothetical protein